MTSTPISKPVNAFLRPGVALMQRLRMPVKLIGVAVVALAPLLAVGLAMLMHIDDEYQFARNEAAGAQTVLNITDVVLQTQTHRGQTNQFLSGNTSVAGARDQTRQKLGDAISALETRIQTVPQFQLQSRWATLKPALQQLLRDEPGQDRATVFAAHTAQIDLLRHLAGYTGETSGLLLDPYPDTFFLMDVVVDRFIPWVELTGVMRGAGAGVLSRAGATEVDGVAVLALANQLDGQTRIIREKLEALTRGKETVPKGWDDALAASSAFSAAVRTAFGNGPPKGDPAAFFAQGTQAIAQGRVFYQASADRLTALLEARRDQAQQRMIVIFSVASLGLVLLVYALICFSRATVSSIHSLKLVMEQGTLGNLAAKIDVKGSDELAQIGMEFERMLTKISELVADVRSSAAMVSHVGRQLVDDGHSLSDRTQSQAASLEQTTANISEVSNTVARNAEAATEVGLMTKSLSVEAENASKLMNQTVDGVGTLKTTSLRMSEIIGTIDSIAFQTNILALNAAVEAARAGELGRGFAVVASEVRSLAGRSQKAAAEVRMLIAESSSRVDSTVNGIREAGELMESLVCGIREVTGNFDAISEGSAKQSSALEEVVQAVGDLDSVTNENSTMVERLSHRSSRLMQRSQQLEEAVSHISLRQASADEAMAMAHKAFEHVQAVGFEKASRDFQNPAGEFIDRDLYVFVFDRQGFYRVMGADQSRVGVNISDVPGLDAVRLLEQSWARADQGGGWVEYNMLNVNTGDVQGKTSYVIPIDDNHLIGSGAYRSNIVEM